MDGEKQHQLGCERPTIGSMLCRWLKALLLSQRNPTFYVYLLPFVNVYPCKGVSQQVPYSCNSRPPC